MASPVKSVHLNVPASASPTTPPAKKKYLSGTLTHVAVKKLFEGNPVPSDKAKRIDPTKVIVPNKCPQSPKPKKDE